MGPDLDSAAARYATAAFRALGTTAQVTVLEPAVLHVALELLRDQVDELDRAVSRFRDDSDVARLAHAGGRALVVAPLTVEAVQVAIDMARRTAGIVDPTVGPTMAALGWDDGDFDAVSARPAQVHEAAEVPGWQVVDVDPDRGTVRVPAGLVLDLGATAKAFAADRAARDIHERTGSGVLVNLGGDIAIAGPVPEGGWRVRVLEDHAAPGDDTAPVVCLHGGGMATSSTTVRRWRTRDADGAVHPAHHIVDPRTGHPVEEHVRTATVVARTCALANAASTASVVLGEEAAAWLQRHRCAARLVGRYGEITTIGGWPTDEIRNDDLR